MRFNRSAEYGRGCGISHTYQRPYRFNLPLWHQQHLGIGGVCNNPRPARSAGRRVRRPATRAGGRHRHALFGHSIFRLWVPRWLVAGGAHQHGDEFVSTPASTATSTTTTTATQRHDWSPGWPGRRVVVAPGVHAVSSLWLGRTQRWKVVTRATDAHGDSIRRRLRLCTSSCASPHQPVPFRLLVAVSNPRPPACQLPRHHSLGVPSSPIYQQRQWRPGGDGRAATAGGSRSVSPRLRGEPLVSAEREHSLRVRSSFSFPFHNTC